MDKVSQILRVPVKKGRGLGKSAYPLRLVKEAKAMKTHYGAMNFMVTLECGHTIVVGLRRYRPKAKKMRCLYCGIDESTKE